MSTGKAMHHVGGRDRPVPHTAPYQPRSPKPTGLDWSQLGDQSRPSPASAAPALAFPTEIDTTRRLELQIPNDPPPRHRNSPCTTVPVTEEPTMPEITAPDRDILTVSPTTLAAARLLETTVAHPDKMVRDLRRLTAQALMALSTAVEQTARPADVADELSPAEYRAWAKEHGHACPARGQIPAAVKTAYALAEQVRRSHRAAKEASMREWSPRPRTPPCARTRSATTGHS